MTSSDCEYCNLNKHTYDLKGCVGCAVRLVKTASKGFKQREAMLHYISRYQRKEEVSNRVFKRSRVELPTSNEGEVKPTPNSQASLF